MSQTLKNSATLVSISVYVDYPLNHFGRILLVYQCKCCNLIGRVIAHFQPLVCGGLVWSKSNSNVSSFLCSFGGTFQLETNG